MSVQEKVDLHREAGEPKGAVSETLSESDSEKSDSEKEYLLRLPLSSTPPRPYSACRSWTFLCALTFFSALGGFLFGYDTGVVSGAMLKVREHFHLTPVYVELIVSVTIAGAAISALAGGPLSDLFGRKPVLVLASFVFTLGAIVISAAPTPLVLLVGRFIIGVGVGLAAMAVPMYIAESAPAAMRGKLVVVYILFVTGGQFIATLIDGAFSGLSLNIGWRVMMGLAGVPSLIMFLGLLFMPETPRWLVFHGKSTKARKILQSMRRPEEVGPELEEIIVDYQEHRARKMGWWQLLVKFFTTRSVMLALMVGCGLQMFQQFGGINTVMYYSASIIQMAGFSDSNAIWLATIPAFGNFIFTIVGILLVDRIGRRKLLIGSITGVVFCLVLLGVSFYVMDIESPGATPLRDGQCGFHTCGACIGNSQCGFCVEHVNDSYVNGTCSQAVQLNNGSTRSKYLLNDTSLCGLFSERSSLNSLDTDSRYSESWFGDPSNQTDPDRKWFFDSCPNSRLAPLTIVVLFLYIAFFAPGMGPLPWTINSEIYPTWARSTAIAIATTVNWLCNLLVSMTFLTFTDSIGQPATFWMYSGLGVLGLAFMVLLVPETKGRKLEEVDELFQRPWFMRWCRA